MAATIRARPATPPTTPPTIDPTFFELELPSEPEGTVVDEAPLPGTLTVMVVVMMPRVVVNVESDLVELAFVPGIGLATISPDAAPAAHPMKYAPFKGS
jgi:hypothetical protein